MPTTANRTTWTNEQAFYCQAMTSPRSLFRIIETIRTLRRIYLNVNVKIFMYNVNWYILKESCNTEMNVVLLIMLLKVQLLSFFLVGRGSRKIPGIPTLEFRPMESSTDWLGVTLAVATTLDVYYDVEIPNCFTLSVSHESFRLRKRHSEYYKNGKFTLQSATYAMGAQNGWHSRWIKERLQYIVFNWNFWKDANEDA